MPKFWVNPWLQWNDIGFPSIVTLVVNLLGPYGSYMIHGSYEKYNCPEAKGLVDNTSFLFTKKLIGRLNVDGPLLIYQR